jgi:hypothetical protein
VSAADELTGALTTGGMTAGDAAKLIARFAVELSSNSPSKAALRTRRWRDKRASQTVTERHAVTPPENPPSTVTKRHRTSQTVTW